MSLYRSLAACIVALVALSPTLASASIFGNALTSGLNNVQDQNREWLIKAPGNTGPANVIQNGDILESVLFFDTILNSNGSQDVGNFPGLAGLTAWSRVVVTITGGSGNNTQFSFAPALPNGMAISVFESSTLNDASDFQSGNTTTLVADVVDGNHLFDLGFDNIDDFWTASGPVNLSNLLLFPANFNFGLTVYNNTALVPIVTDAFTDSGMAWDIVGSGSVEALPPGNNSQGVQAQSNTNIFLVAAPVPEPASLCTWAGILVGCGVVLRKRLASAGK